MKKIYVLFVVATAIMFMLVTTSYAGSKSIGIKTSTLGVGPEVGYSFNNSFGIRAGFNYFSITRSSNEGNIDYDLKAKLRNFDFLIDWHPFKGKFRITAGLLYNKNKLEGHGKATGNETFTIGNKKYNVSDIGSIYGRIEYQDLNPYFGFGWDTSAGKDKGLGFTFDLGAIYQGNSKITLTPTFTAAGKYLANDPTFKKNLAQEISNTKNDANKLKIWPVVSVGLVYRF